MDPSEGWKERIGRFAELADVSFEEASARLARIVGEPNDDGLELLSSAADAPDTLLRELFPEVPVARLNRAIRRLRRPAASSEESVPAAPSVMLPKPPDDESFLDALKVGGVAKVSATDINAALRALLARDLGVFDLPEKLLAAMEAHAETIDEPVDATFYELQKVVLERRYGEILGALGVPGRLVSDARKKRLFDRLTSIWGALAGFQGRLDAWLEAWTARVANPAALMTSMAAVFGGGAAPPAHIMEHPDAGPVRDAGEGVVDTFNKVFAGTGIPVARALAYDALRVKRILEDARLPAAVGAASREELLKKLGVAVTADYVRLERDLATYVLSILELPLVARPSEPGYLVALQQLGASIPWSTLGGGGGEKGSARHKPGRQVY